MKVKSLHQINAANIKGYFQGNSRKIFNEWFNMSKDHIKEQAMWRLERIKEKSPKCLENDECIHCGCQVSGKVWEDRACEGECYPKMMNKEEWDNSKVFYYFFDKLRRDKDLWETYKSNIAIDFIDQYYLVEAIQLTQNKSITSEQLHAIANQAAENFLTRLTKI